MVDGKKPEPLNASALFRRVRELEAEIEVTKEMLNDALKECLLFGKALTIDGTKYEIKVRNGTHYLADVKGQKAKARS